jgi:hypothetical protein
MVEPSGGVDARAKIDTEIVRGLVVANGGGAVALLAFLPATFEKMFPLSIYIVFALFTFHLGILAAIIHNYFRRRCSLKFEQHKFRPPAEQIFGLNLGRPIVCFISSFCMWASMSLFLIGGSIVFVGALRVVLR